MAVQTAVADNDTLPEPDRMAEDFVKMSLLVADPGSSLYSVLGHACIHAQCPYYDIDYLYSYESEQVGGRVLRFLANQLKMGMMYMPVEDYLIDYHEAGRGVREYTLHLPPEVETELWRVLDSRVEEGINLEYDYIKRGCAISVFRFIQEGVAAANALHSTPQSADFSSGGFQTDETECYRMVLPDLSRFQNKTLRELFYDNAPRGWGLFFCMTLVGGDVDKPDLPAKDKVIVPADLVSVLQKTTVNSTAVISEPPQELLPAVRHYDGGGFTPMHLSLIFLILAFLSIFLQKPYVDWLVLAVQTLLGCLMLWLLISPLPGSEWNWLIVVFNPLPAVFWHWRKYWAVPYAALTVVWIIAMVVAPHRLVSYEHLVLAAAFGAVLLKPEFRALFF